MMKYVIICALVIYVIIVTNLLTFGATYMINDYLWQQHTEQTEYKIFSAMHRSCMIALQDNNICNLKTHDIYSIYRHDYSPLPGFDFDLITLPDEKESY